MKTRDLLYKNIANFRRMTGDSASTNAFINFKLKSALKYTLLGIRRRKLLDPNAKVSPLALNIETTSLCNAGCVMCPRTQRKLSRENLMDYSTVFKLMTTIPHKVFAPNGFGEALIDKSIPDYIRIAKRHHKLTRLTTNASLLNNLTTAKLMLNGLDNIVLSVDAMDPETYHKIRPRLDWNTTQRNIQLLKWQREFHESDIYINLNIVQTKANRGQIDDIANFWYPHVDVVRTLPASRHWKEIKALGEKIPIRMCWKPWEVMYVFSDGTVPLCTRDVEGDYSLGNALKTDNIWNGKVARAYRKAILKGDPPEICHYCEVAHNWEYYEWNGGLVKCKTV